MSAAEMDRARKLYNTDPTFRKLAKRHLSYLITRHPGKDFNYAALALLMALADRENRACPPIPLLPLN